MDMNDCASDIISTISTSAMPSCFTDFPLLKTFKTVAFPVPKKYDVVSQPLSAWLLADVPECVCVCQLLAFISTTVLPGTGLSMMTPQLRSFPQ